MNSRTPEESSRWAAIAAARGWSIPEKRMENIAPILDDLEAKSSVALDRDLSLVEPIFSFRPVVSAASATGEED